MHSDADFFGFVPGPDPNHFRFTVNERLARLDGKLYGGTAIAISVALSELVTERSPLWITTQYVSTVAEGTEVDVHVEVLAPGKRTNQVRVTGVSPTGDIVFASLGATGHHDPEGLTGEFEGRPEVEVPQVSRPWLTPFAGLARSAGVVDLPEMPMRGFASAIEMREPAIIEHPDPGPGRLCLWIRRRDGGPATPAMAAYFADVVPMGIAHALGVMAGGTSLDNTIRFGPAGETEWVLMDLRPHFVAGGYGHGVVHLWSEAGHLLATASQTARMIKFDPANLPSFAPKP